ncbi:MAG: ABC transporter ATP-binding protein [Aminobacterium sp.]|jgi:iron(III) transport system ATP-binding protein|nr:ABC transporter ATP-binding protein [Aminobacterium sp.]MDD3708597.1 ABC transporter ATP-binding protein [Aminobacterium sp.]MDD4229187.1 ABC transporter ATP-binding protein [Aminobacterium sp.]
MSLSISLQHLTKIFTKGKESFKAVDNIHLDINAGELVTFLGPSGCGKTTILRMIAGFETPTEGHIYFDGKNVTSIDANKRDIGFVFQNYALFPHMNVFDNVSYGLKVRGATHRKITDKVAEVLALVGLKNVENRFPNQLSGGEQQRVALARVFAINPNLLLMDEPLSNLDAKLRTYMRTEIRRLQKQLGITCIYVTHDQKEALTIADRIVVLNKGRIEQVATPFDLYAHPQTLFVADFIGQANIFNSKVQSFHDESLDVLTYGNYLTIQNPMHTHFSIGEEIALVVRPESIRLEPTANSTVHGIVRSCVFVGDKMEYEIELEPGHLIHAFIPYSHETKAFSEGDRVGIYIDPRDITVLPF